MKTILAVVVLGLVLAGCATTGKSSTNHYGGGIAGGSDGMSRPSTKGGN